jgi:hypothetical protein
VVVTGPDGTPVQHGPVEVAGDKVTVAIRATASGTYHVAYRVVSDDGHPVTGETTFTVGTTGSSGSPTTAPPTAGAGHDDHADDVDGSSGFSRGRVIGIGAGIALLAGLALLTVRRLPGGLVDPRGKGSP